MRQSLKISLSLLISVVLFAAFAVLAYRGLFAYVQAAFFQPQVLEERGAALEAAAGVVERYHQRNVERFRAVLQEPFIARAFSTTGQQSREDIFNRSNLFGRLLEEYPNLLGVRFLDPDGERVHFSTFRQDASYGADRLTVTYLDFSRSEPSLKGAPLLGKAEEEPRLLVDGPGERLIYSLPVTDLLGGYRGAALFFFSASDLQAALAPGLRELLLVDRLGVLVNYPDAARELVASSVASSWTRQARPAESQDTVELEGPGGSTRHLLLTRPAGRYGLVGWLVPYTAIELQPLLKAILLAAVLLTVFLLVFLVFNIRQDPQVLLVRRIKRFQLEVLAELIEGKERVDWRRWRDQLAADRTELRSRIKRGIGRIPSTRQGELDGLIDRGWDEIIGIIEARLGEQGREKVAISQIEEMIQKALERGRFTVAGTLPAAAPVLPAETEVRKPPAAPRRESLVVEEIGVEEVSELSEAGPEPAIAAAAEEVEEVAEAEEVAPEPAISAAAEEVAEAEEAEEAEEVEEVEEIGQQPAIAAQSQAAAVVGVEEPEEPEEPEEVAEAEEVGRQPAIAARQPAIAARQPAIAAAAATQPAALEPALEELETVGEIIPLPPELQEKLEELPQVEEPVRLKPEARKPAELEEVQAAAETLETQEAAAEEEPEATEPELVSVEAEPRTIQELLETPGELELEESAAARSPAEELELLDRLASQGALRTFSLAEFAAQIREQRTSVVMENGVYKVKEVLRQASERGRGGVPAAPAAAGAGRDAGRRGLKALAEAILTTGGEEESGIGALLDAEPGLDLSAELGSSAARRGLSAFSGPKRARRIRFTDGLDYDQYLEQFRIGVSETGSLRSLVELSRKIKAVNAALLIKTGEAYVSRLRIGLMAKPERILFSAGEPFYDRFLSQRRAVLLLERLQIIPSLATRFNPEDLKYMKVAIFLPALYQKAPAVLFLALPVRRTMELKDVIHELEVYI